jgi:hypothetical protein
LWFETKEVPRESGFFCGPKYFGPQPLEALAKWGNNTVRLHTSWETGVLVPEGPATTRTASSQLKEELLHVRHSCDCGRYRRIT